MVTDHELYRLKIHNIFFMLLELRLEEDSRLLDLRLNKISHLEAQLKSIVYGTTKGIL